MSGTQPQRGWPPQAPFTNWPITNWPISISQWPLGYYYGPLRANTNGLMEAQGALLWEGPNLGSWDIGIEDHYNVAIEATLTFRPLKASIGL